MCYATKKKIADCVKTLVRKKEISKITIQDIMDETRMSRQSFYYHFKDIYDVIRWIGMNDFEEQLLGEDYASLEDWFCDMIAVLRREKVFYEKVAQEVEWPRISRYASVAIEAQLKRILSYEIGDAFKENKEEFEDYGRFLALAVSYYLTDFSYNRKKISDDRIRRDICFMKRMLGNNRTIATMYFDPMLMEIEGK